MPATGALTMARGPGAWLRVSGGPPPAREIRVPHPNRPRTLGAGAQRRDEARDGGADGARVLRDLVAVRRVVGLHHRLLHRLHQAHGRAADGADGVENAGLDLLVAAGKRGALGRAEQAAEQVASDARDLGKVLRAADLAGGHVGQVRGRIDGVLREARELLLGGHLRRVGDELQRRADVLDDAVELPGLLVVALQRADQVLDGRRRLCAVPTIATIGPGEHRYVRRCPRHAWEARGGATGARRRTTLRCWSSF